MILQHYSKLIVAKFASFFKDGLDSKLRAMAENLTYDVVFSSEIEDISLNIDQVRSSIAGRLGIENVKYTAPSHYVDSVVGVMLDAIQHFDQPLSKEKLCAWQASFFPIGISEGSQIKTGLNTIVLSKV